MPGGRVPGFPGLPRPQVPPRPARQEPRKLTPPALPAVRPFPEEEPKTLTQPKPDLESLVQQIQREIHDERRASTDRWASLDLRMARLEEQSFDTHSTTRSSRRTTIIGFVAAPIATIVTTALVVWAQFNQKTKELELQVPARAEAAIEGEVTQKIADKAARLAADAVERSREQHVRRLIADGLARDPMSTNREAPPKRARRTRSAVAQPGTGGAPPRDRLDFGI